MDIIDPALRSRLMGSIRSTNTKPELYVRRVAHAMGYRFRLHRKDLPGRPDLAFPKYRTVIFVHGCFWHRHPRCVFATTPKTRAAFWATKFAANVERDSRNKSDLRRLGWRVIVLWECELARPNFVERALAKAFDTPVRARNHG